MSSTITRAPRRNRQFWINHVERWRSSNLSKAAYCEQHSLSIGNFYNWSRPERGVNVKADQREHQRPEGKSVVTHCSRHLHFNSLRYRSGRSNANAAECFVRFTRERNGFKVVSERMQL